MEPLRDRVTAPSPPPPPPPALPPSLSLSPPPSDRAPPPPARRQAYELDPLLDTILALSGERTATLLAYTQRALQTTYKLEAALRAAPLAWEKQRFFRSLAYGGSLASTASDRADQGRGSGSGSGSGSAALVTGVSDWIYTIRLSDVA